MHCTKARQNKIFKQTFGGKYFFEIKLKNLMVFRNNIRILQSFLRYLLAPKKEGKYIVKIEIFGIKFPGILNITNKMENNFIYLIVFEKNIEKLYGQCAMVYSIEFLN